MGTTAIRVLAALMAAAHGVAWAWWSRLERPGREAERRAAIQPPRLLASAGDVAQVAPLVYPVVVAVAPAWGYDGWLNWSSGIDVWLQALGVGIWAVGMSVVSWAASTLKGLMAVDGLAADHELVVRGPYRYVRHPIYAAFTAIAVGTALVFRSYLLVAVAVVWVAAGRWWAAAEERLLGSPEGFGDAYLRYADTTGRFLPRLRRARGRTV